MNDMQKNLAGLAAQVTMLVKASGLTWDEAIAALGVAAKALAVGASTNGDGDEPSCVAQAKKRFEQGLAQKVVFVDGGSDLSGLLKIYGSPADLLMVGGAMRVPFKH